MANPDPTRRRAGQIARGVDVNDVDRNLLVGTDGSLAVSTAGSGLPYGADNYLVTSQVTAGPAVIEYKLGSTILKTLTITYTNAGASASDTIVSGVYS